MKKIGIASDHAGYEMKEFLVGYLNAMGYEVLDFGAHSPESVDYADFAHPLAEAIENGELERGVALCGSGEGMTMTLNKHQGIRAGLCWDTEIASLIRRHNDANIIVFPARFITNDEAVKMLDAYFAAEFEGGRHIARIANGDVRSALGAVELAVQDMLYDPQTAGGLLIACDPADADALFAALKDAVPSAQRVGTVQPYAGSARIYLK